MQLSLYPALLALFESADSYCFLKDQERRYRFANAAVCRLFGLPREQVLGQGDERFFQLEHSTDLVTHDRRVLERGEEVHAAEQVTMLGGDRRVFRSLKLPWRDADGRIRGLLGLATDITEARRDTQALLRHNQMLSAVLDQVDACVYLKSHEGRYLYVNPKVAELYGRATDDILGRQDDELLPPDVAAALRRTDATVLSNGQRLARQETVSDRAGRERQFWSIKLPIPLPGMPPGVIGFSTDITELLALRGELEAERSIDALTGLASRPRFEAELALDLTLAERDAARVAVVVLDADQFKYVNNSLGQAVGDALLRELGARLRAGAGGSSTRLFGDEFAFSLPRYGSAEQLASTVEGLRHALAAPYHLGGHELRLTVSAGVAVFPEDGGSSTALISRAETAMHHAKAQGRNRQQFYAQQIGDAVSQRLALERDLRAAVAAMDFELHYQPKLRVDGGLAGFEALLRWRRPGHGPVSPALFIPLAEQTGLIDAIGTWVVQQACAQMAAWRDAGLGEVPVAVNMSTSQLRDPGLVAWLAGVRQAHGIADGQLEMEVTESMMMDDPEQAILSLEALRQQGIHLAIDDFGTGYSSMGYLKRIPVHTLKLDRVFVAQVDSDARDADICAGMIALAHQLGLDVVAEGVETDAQRAALAARGCDVFQGYLFARPLPVAEATRYLLACAPTARSGP
ncbi:putative bifunctional diguanylate cyclase/phosphodiesterase [Roseateles sp. BYS78W]|uniref:Bifunctional diguanylate cyclase/phosphodiesterase n=1 Tax=Pelomonas candidula TaxID=3299025 RepID=A0ABW7H5F1_9BURK